MFLLQCPKCRNKMKYQNAEASLMNKKKKCVYCGFSFSVNANVVKKI